MLALGRVEAGERYQPVGAGVSAVVGVECLERLGVFEALDLHEALNLERQSRAEQRHFEFGRGRAPPRPSSPAATESAASIPAVKSARARPPTRRGTASPGAVPAASRPERAWPIRS